LQVFKVDKNKMMELILVIGIIFIICLGLWLKKLNDNYIDEYNKRYIEKIKQNVARSLVNPYRKK
tara:strand:+ start:1531 stop:1725 length:195 start_codon:yes stop_codon:yes gene_type:complete